MTRLDDPSAPRPRRAFLALAAAGAGAAAAAAIASCGDNGEPAPQTQTISTAQLRTDGAALNALLDLEYASVAAYGLISERLRGADRAHARVVLRHEREHVAALETAVRGVGAEPVENRGADYLAGLPAIRTRDQALAFATDLENTAVAAYIDALGTVATDQARVRIAAILVTEGEHLAATRMLLGRPVAPRAFVTGDTPE
jgi:hypothetical protein